MYASCSKKLSLERPYLNRLLPQYQTESQEERFSLSNCSNLVKRNLADAVKMEANNTSNKDGIGSNTISSEGWLPLISFIIHLLFDAFGLIVNIVLAYVIYSKSRKSRKSYSTVQLLICHLALLSVCEMAIRYLNTGQVRHAVNVPGPLCSVVSYSRSNFLENKIR